MREPKFSAGERVILVSKNMPHLNGQTYNVLMVVRCGEPYICPLTKKRCYVGEAGDGNAYILDDEFLLGEPDGYGSLSAIPWAEKSLRKIPPTSEDSFRQMMEKLKQGETELV